MKELIDRLREALGGENETVERIAVDLVTLTARAATGEDVSHELVHIHAQAMNLSAVVAQRTKDVLMTWISEAIGTVLGSVLARP